MPPNFEFTPVSLLLDYVECKRHFSTLKGATKFLKSPIGCCESKKVEKRWYIGSESPVVNVLRDARNLTI